MRQLVLKNSMGETTRYMPWTEGEKAYVIVRKGNRRLDIVPSEEDLEAQKIEFDLIQEVTAEQLKAGAIKLGSSNTLELVTDLGPLVKKPGGSAGRKRLLRVERSCECCFPDDLLHVFPCSKGSG